MIRSLVRSSLSLLDFFANKFIGGLLLPPGFSLPELQIVKMAGNYPLDIFLWTSHGQVITEVIKKALQKRFQANSYI